LHAPFAALLEGSHFFATSVDVRHAGNGGVGL